MNTIDALLDLEKTLVPVHSAGVDCEAECSVCRRCDRQDGLSLPHMLGQCLRLLRDDATRFAASATPDGVPGEVWIGRRMDHDGHWTFSREWHTTPHGDVLREHYIHASRLAQAREEEREACVAITLAHRGWSEEASHLKNSIIDAIRERGKR